ncbi:uncharacterized protein [Ptychodera flava]|uniref:uncharacterized protein n=1 Tax=Ptychodera flava TaxID=63121 RepID=UPI00396A85D9
MNRLFVVSILFVSVSLLLASAQAPWQAPQNVPPAAAPASKDTAPAPNPAAPANPGKAGANVGGGKPAAAANRFSSFDRNLLARRAANSGSSRLSSWRDKYRQNRGRVSRPVGGTRGEQEKTALLKQVLNKLDHEVAGEKKKPKTLQCRVVCDEEL